MGCLFLVGCQLNDDAQDNGKADKTPVDMQDNVDNDIKEPDELYEDGEQQEPEPDPKDKNHLQNHPPNQLIPTTLIMIIKTLMVCAQEK